MPDSAAPVPEFVQIVTTVSSRSEAKQIVEAIVGQRLAACGQVVGPIDSVYWWDGQLESAEEWMCILKSSATYVAEVQAHLRHVHPYDVPEVLVVPVIDGSPAYLEWLRSELRPLPAHS